MTPGTIVRIEGRQGRWELIEPAPSKNGPAWWCLPIRSGQPTRQYGWSAFSEERMDKVDR